ncbi:Serine/threonine-protein phosphatase 2A activator 1 [Fonsecaea pedrosoi]|nr:Serine/threonine-protein phosphatase 2A activator 1 [Fonsecaea pedrosoi]
MANFPLLAKIADVKEHRFEKPVKKIFDGPDVSFFLMSLAYRDIMIFMLQLNRSVLPRKVQTGGKDTVSVWRLNSEEVVFSEAISRLRTLLDHLIDLVDAVPPDTGPRRFGNVSFRKWYKIVEGEVGDLLAQHLPEELGPAHEELSSYLLGSLGSSQRLDYGTGHELSFLAFLACLWKLSFFAEREPGVEERGIVLGVFELYLVLIRKLIKTYTLEPAGSHGVWGLDDNSFLPYIFGSAQLCPPIAETDDTPTEGSLPSAPDASAVTKLNLVEKEKDSNMYFSAIAFIYDVKRGPFWEHSPMLFDISGIKDGWGKINKGMIKMYNAEVLSKFPVVQHFPFGSLFKWEKDPEAKPPPPSTHAASQPLRNPTDTNAPSAMRPGGPPMGSTAAPWASKPSATPAGFVNGVTQAPWAGRAPPPPPPRGGFAAAQRRPLQALKETETKTTQQVPKG